MTAINRARLLSVVNGDFSPYQKVTWGVMWTAPVGCENEPFKVVDTDFDLLRHDIHVLLHAARTTGGEDV